jgi:hypothetical protein
MMSRVSKPPKPCRALHVCATWSVVDMERNGLSFSLGLLEEGLMLFLDKDGLLDKVFVKARLKWQRERAYCKFADQRQGH